MTELRKIIHVDMDAFYASVEQRDHPELRGLPVIVGGSERRGVVLTASYEARVYGVRSAMSGREAHARCPHGIFVRPRFEAYKEASRLVHAVFAKYTDIIEPLSLDEAYLDVTHDKPGIGSAIDIAKKIKEEIFEKTQLTASAGVSVNKFVAKVASGWKKPNGLTFIGPSKIEAFMEQLKVSDFHGIGKVTAERMNKMGIFTGADLKQLTYDEILRRFGKTGKFYYNIVRGIDDRPVVAEREAKSVSAEETFSEDILELHLLDLELEQLVERVFRRLEKYSLAGRTVVLKVKYHDFKSITRSKTFPAQITDPAIVYNTAAELLRMTEAGYKKIRLLGVGVSGFEEPGYGDQLSLF